MALFNSSFNLGFFCGLANWLAPPLMFRRTFMCSNPFMGWSGMFDDWRCNNYFSPQIIGTPSRNIWENYNYTPSWEPTSETSAQYSYTPFNIQTPVYSQNSSTTWQNSTNLTNTQTNWSIWNSTPVYQNNYSSYYYQTPAYQPSATVTAAKASSVTATNKSGSGSSLNTSTDNITVTGYNSERGTKLAQVAKNRAHGTKNCARYVREALDISGILTTSELGNMVHEHAYQWIGILRKFPNKFKEIQVTDTNYLHLPAGAVMVYERGVGKYSSTSGHAQIATGDGKAAHYCIQNTIKKPTAIFIPV